MTQHSRMNESDEVRPTDGIQDLGGRRQALGMIGSAITLALTGCGGGGESGSSSSSASSASSAASSSSTASSASSSSSSSSSAASSSSSSSAVTGPTTAELWGNTGWDATPVYSSTAVYPVLDDFAEVTPPVAGTYKFRLPSGCNTTANKSYTDSSGNTVTIVCSAGGETVALTSSYYMSKYLVTDGNWKAYCEATGSTVYPSYWSAGAYPSGREYHPVMGLSYNQALPYVAWLSTYLSGLAGRTITVSIPTELQWEWAALGQVGTDNNWVYPWGTSTGFSASGTGIVYGNSDSRASTARYKNLFAGSGTVKAFYNCNTVCAERAANSGMTTVSYYTDTVVTGSVVPGTTTVTSTYITDASNPYYDTAPLTSVITISSTGGVSGWQYDSSTNLMYADFANSDQFKRVKDVWGGYTTPVGWFENGKSWCGCYDMSGNAFEWTSSTGIATNGAEAGDIVNVVRGGSWYSTSGSGSCILRGEGRAPGSGTFSVGFRVCYV